MKYALWKSPFLALFLAVGPSAALAQVYRCELPNGSVAFQQTPCVAGQQPITAGTTASSSPDQDDLIATALLAKLGCDAVVPGFRAQSSSAFAAWRGVHAAAISRVEASADYRTRVAESRQLLESEQPSSADVAEMRGYCENQLLPLLAKQGAPADGRFRSPQSTFNAFVAALRRADRAAALACLSDVATDEVRGQIESLPPEKLRETGNSFRGSLLLGEMLGPLQTAKAPRTDGREHTVFFDRLPNGDWKISGI
jgi:hypothetical protein